MDQPISLSEKIIDVLRHRGPLTAGELNSAIGCGIEMIRYGLQQLRRENKVLKTKGLWSLASAPTTLLHMKGEGEKKSKTKTRAKVIVSSKRKMNKALKAFRRVHPEWTVTTRGTRCPECAIQYTLSRKGLNFCRRHKFANGKWLTGERGLAMITEIARRDLRLKNELTASGLWFTQD